MSNFEHLRQILYGRRSHATLLDFALILNRKSSKNYLPRIHWYHEPTPYWYHFPVIEQKNLEDGYVTIVEKNECQKYI